MDLLTILKQSTFYTRWCNFREKQQSVAYNRFLKRNLESENTVVSDSRTATKAKLFSKIKDRSLIPKQHNQINVIAFGTNDWEKYGLWPTFERLCNFTLFDYQKDMLRRHQHITTIEEKNILKDKFLYFIDSLGSGKSPHIVYFYAAGTYICNELLLELHKRKIWTIILSLDDKQQFMQSDDQMRVASLCDLYITNWRAGVQFVANRGGTPWYAAEAASPEYFRNYKIERDIQVLFLGGSYGKRGNFVEQLRKSGIVVNAFGDGWPKGFVEFDSMIELYNRAQIVLGIGSVGHMSAIKHLKGRDFEVPMCGSLYLTSYNPELTDHFDIGKEILCYSSLEECIELIHWALRNQKVAESIRVAALNRSLLEHTWEIRIKSILTLFPIN
jgi:hypothetical protein